MRSILPLAFLPFLLAQTTAPATQPAAPPPRILNFPVTTPSGLTYHFSQLGEGPIPKTGDTLVIHGIGRFTDGREFWNTRTTNRPYEYRLGVDRVIRGFAEGMTHIRQGDRIIITMNPDLAYGARGNRDIPPNATLIFDYEILSLKPATATTTPQTQ